MVKFYDLVNRLLAERRQEIDADLLNRAYLFVLRGEGVDLPRLHRGLVFAKHFWRGGKTGKCEYGAVAFQGAVELALSQRPYAPVRQLEVELIGSEFS